MRVVFFGASRFVIPIIELLRKKFDLDMVITTEKQSSDPVPSYCNKHGIKYISVSSLSDPNWKLEIGNWKLEIAILAYFGLLVPTNVLNIFPKGIINIHPSLLPKYRGPTPVQTAILNGDEKTGVTIIKLDEKLDHGPILAQAEEPILANDTAETLHERLFKLGADLWSKNIDQYLNDSIALKKQDNEKATYTKHLARADGYVDMSKLKSQNSKVKIERMIRAYHPWPGTWSELRIKNRELRIKFLPNQKLQVEGKRPMSYKDFINGYPHAKGVILPILQISNTTNK